MLVSLSSFPLELDPENAAPGTIYRISDLELASRLSFFIWSIPRPVTGPGGSRQLKNLRFLKQQVRRMLADQRARRWAPTLRTVVVSAQYKKSPSR